MNKLRLVFVMLLLAILIAPFGFTGKADQLRGIDPDSDEVSVFGNVKISGTTSGHVTVSVDRSVPFRGIEADGVPDITFHFVPRKNKPEFQNIAFDLEGATVAFTDNEMTVISSDRYIILNLSLKKRSEKKNIFSFDDSPDVVRIRGGIAFGQYKGTGANVEGLWLCGDEGGTCAVLKKGDSLTAYDGDPLPEGPCPSGGQGATSCGINCGAGQGCNVSCGSGTYACCHCTNGCHCVSSS